MPMSAGAFSKKRSSACTPPADAPIPTTGKSSELERWAASGSSLLSGGTVDVVVSLNPGASVRGASMDERYHYTVSTERALKRSSQRVGHRRADAPRRHRIIRFYLQGNRRRSLY